MFVQQAKPCCIALSPVHTMAPAWSCRAIALLVLMLCVAGAVALRRCDVGACTSAWLDLAASC